MQNDRLGGVRLNKFLVEAGICSRREADRWIAAGRVTVNREPAVLGVKVEKSDIVHVDGRKINTQERRHVYLAYHKPVGIICTSDPHAKDNIIDAIDYPERIFHIGRLDVASSGIILLTNDGEVVNKILRSEGQHEKEYIVKVTENLTQEDLQTMRTGADIGDPHRTLPAMVIKMGPRMFAITIVEGRNRQIRRMCEALGYEVEALKRIRVMNITVDNLPPGKWRELTNKEREDLLRSLN